MFEYFNKKDHLKEATSYLRVYGKDLIRVEVIFKGYVQGVGFRYETYNLANELGLSGYVLNLSNGGVKAQVQGEAFKVYYLIESLKKLKRADVRQVSINNISLLDDEKNFSIYYA